MRVSKFLAAVLLLFALYSCKKKTEINLPKGKNLSLKNPAKQLGQEVHQELYGIYTGEFIGREMIESEDNSEIEFDNSTKISVKINRITKDSVYGHSIVKGKQRKFRGIYDPGVKNFVLDEPGTDKTDGRFNVSLKGDSIVGSWLAYNNSSVKSPNKKLKLVKSNFVYNPNFMLDNTSDLMDYENSKIVKEQYTDSETNQTEIFTVKKVRSASTEIFKLNASTNKLSEKQLKNLRKIDLEIIKNTICPPRIFI